MKCAMDELCYFMNCAIDELCSREHQAHSPEGQVPGYYKDSFDFLNLKTFFQNICHFLNSIHFFFSNIFDFQFPQCCATASISLPEMGPRCCATHDGLSKLI